MDFSTKLKIRLERMTVTGDDECGWSARYAGDPNRCWAAKRETAIFACQQRKEEVLRSTLVRGPTCYYHPLS